MPNSMWFTRSNLVERPSSDYILCSTCRNRVALVADHIQTVHPGGIFNGVYNVEVNNHDTLFDSTIANVYCDRCETQLGWKFIKLPQQDNYVREGRFFMVLHKLCYWNDEPLLHEEQDLGANEENANQDGDANDENADQDGDATDQDGDANDENADQDGDSTDQDGDTNEQDLDDNKENIDQNVGANVQNADQGDDEDGGAPMN